MSIRFAVFAVLHVIRVDFLSPLFGSAFYAFALSAFSLSPCLITYACVCFPRVSVFLLVVVPSVCSFSTPTAPARHIADIRLQVRAGARSKDAGAGRSPSLRYVHFRFTRVLAFGMNSKGACSGRAIAGFAPTVPTPWSVMRVTGSL